MNWSEYKLFKIDVKNKVFVFCTKKDWDERRAENKHDAIHRVEAVVALDVSCPAKAKLFKKDVVRVKTNYNSERDFPNWVEIVSKEEDKDWILLHVVDVISRYNISEARFD